MNSILLPLLLLAPLAAPAAETERPDYAKELKEVEAKIKKDRRDPMLYYRKARYLCELGKYDEGYETAELAMRKFIAAKKDLAWLMLEQVWVGNYRVDVHFNMGPKERTRRKNGIVRPLTLRIWDPDVGQMLDAIDYEVAYIKGKPLTAAFGQTIKGGGHALLEPSKPGLRYSEIRREAIVLVEKRYSGR